jgi:hypothetical protein
VIRLAREEMSVPTPPIFTPTKRGLQFVVNSESKIADGTLLMIWQERTLVKSAFFSSRKEKKLLTASILDTLPAKRKKAVNVRRRG